MCFGIIHTHVQVTTPPCGAKSIDTSKDLLSLPFCTTPAWTRVRDGPALYSGPRCALNVADQLPAPASVLRLCECGWRRASGSASRRH